MLRIRCSNCQGTFSTGLLLCKHLLADHAVVFSSLCRYCGLGGAKEAKILEHEKVCSERPASTTAQNQKKSVSPQPPPPPPALVRRSEVVEKAPEPKPVARAVEKAPRKPKTKAELRAQLLRDEEEAKAAAAEDVPEPESEEEEHSETAEDEEEEEEQEKHDEGVKLTINDRGLKVLSDKGYTATQHNPRKGEWTCDTCNGVFTSGSRVRAHLRTHTGERPFKCRVCMKGFTYSGSRGTHERTHAAAMKRDGVKQFACTRGCGKKFRGFADLVAHVEQVQLVFDKLFSTMFFFLWIGFWLSRHHFCKVSDFSETIEPC
jgi:hypothetical protein